MFSIKYLKSHISNLWYSESTPFHFLVFLHLLLEVCGMESFN